MFCYYSWSTILDIMTGRKITNYYRRSIVEVPKMLVPYLTSPNVNRIGQTGGCAAVCV